MKKWLVLLALSVALTVGVAFAQPTLTNGEEDLTTGLAAWFVSVAALGGLVCAPAVAFIRKHVWAAEGVMVIVLSSVIGVAVAVVGSLVSLHSMNLLSSVVFGVAAGLWASGAKDLADTITGLFRISRK